MKIVISQPMYMPWYGLFEQVKFADIYVHYDDVQLPTKSSFMTRVQVKLSNGLSWLTLPVNRSNGRHSAINECILVKTDWREKHLSTLYHAYHEAEFFHEMYSLASSILADSTDNLSTINKMSIEKISEYLNFSPKFASSSSIQCIGKKSERLLKICKYFNADTYITGLGAIDYLNNELFEDNNIKVLYPKYSCSKYKQFYGEFTQYVSILDMIAHCGKSSINNFTSTFMDWREAKAISRVSQQN